MTPEETLALHNIARQAGNCAIFLGAIYFTLVLIALKVLNK